MGSFIIVVVFGDMFLLFLALNLAVLGLILLLLFGSFNLVLLIQGLESLLGRGVNIGPHITDDFGDLGDFGRRIFGLYSIIHFSSIKEKS